MNNRRIEIAAGQAASVQLHEGARVRVVNVFGGQVVDAWMFASADDAEFLSMEHSRTANYRLLFKPGDRLMSNRFRVMATIERDTSPGWHDTLHAACSAASNRHFGLGPELPNCSDNLAREVGAWGGALAGTPCPWNLFEHALVDRDMTLHDEPAAARAGDFIELRIHLSLRLVCSACPSTVGLISGEHPRGAALEIVTD